MQIITPLDSPHLQDGFVADHIIQPCLKRKPPIGELRMLDDNTIR